MNPLTKWNPFRELEDIQNRLSSLFGRTPTARSWGGGNDGQRMDAFGGHR